MQNLTNEADGKDAVRPRLFLFYWSMTKRGWSGRRLRISIGLSATLLLVAAGLTIKSVGTRKSPPILQAFVPATGGQAAIPVATSLKPKGVEPFIRVNLTPGGADSVQLEVRVPCKITSLETKKQILSGLPAGSLVVSSSKNGLRIGEQQFAATQIEIVTEQSPGIRVNRHLYRGKMRLFRRTDGKVSAVNVLPIEDYLASVIDSEMPSKFPDAARQAQAIVARTYALYQMEKADPVAVYDLLASQRSQKYLGVEYFDRNRRLAGESESSRKIVAATRGLVCKRNGRLFCTYYSAVCGGQTTNGQLVFKDAVDVVKSVPCEWCNQSPHYRWRTELSQEDFSRMIFNRQDEFRNSSVQSISQNVDPGAGQISQFQIDDGQKNICVTGIELRERLPAGTLSSPHFFMKLENGRVIFEGRGHGHGVGFCQWGAKGQAEAGRDCQDIIRHYYPGVEITEIGY